MAGELGRGTPSLRGCADKEPPVCVLTNLTSVSGPPACIRLCMHSCIAVFDIPTKTVELVSRMADFSRSVNTIVPNIVIDSPSV